MFSVFTYGGENRSSTQNLTPSAHRSSLSQRYAAGTWKASAAAAVSRPRYRLGTSSAESAAGRSTSRDGLCIQPREIEVQQQQQQQQPSRQQQQPSRRRPAQIAAGTAKVGARSSTSHGTAPEAVSTESDLPRREGCRKPSTTFHLTHRR